MAESFTEGLHAALLKVVQEDFDQNAVEVVTWEEVTKSDGYCDTCWYEYTNVNITYKDSNGAVRIYPFYDDFATLIRRLGSV